MSTRATCLILRTESTSSTCTSTTSSIKCVSSTDNTLIPDIIKARDTAKRVLERASRVQTRYSVSSGRASYPTFMKNTCNMINDGPSNSPSVGSSLQKARQDIERPPSANDILLSAVPIVIQEGWLNSKDVTRYEMTSKGISMEVNIWKALCRQQHQWVNTDPYLCLLDYTYKSKSSNSSGAYLELFSSPAAEIWFMVAVISTSSFVPMIVAGLEKAWILWAAIYCVIVGLTLLEGILIAAIRFLYSARRAIRHYGMRFLYSARRAIRHYVTRHH